MGWLARVIVPSVAFVLIGCAAIANIGDAQTTDEQNSSGGTSGSSGTSGTRGTSGGTGTPGTGGDGGTTSDGGTTTMTDAGVDAAPTCTKTPKGGACDASAACCSNACASNLKCEDSCKTSGFCSPGNSDCCIGLFCAYDSLSTCQTCRTLGQPADRFPVGNAVIPTTCCTGHVDAMGNCAP